MPQNPIPQPPGTVEDDLDQLFGAKRPEAPATNPAPGSTEAAMRPDAPQWAKDAARKVDVAGNLGTEINRAMWHLAPLVVAPEAEGASLAMKAAGAFSGPALGQLNETLSGQRKWDSPERVARNIGSGLVEGAANMVHLPFIQKLAPVKKFVARIAEGAGVNALAGGGMHWADTGELPSLDQAKRDAIFGGVVGTGLGAAEGVATARARAKAKAETPPASTPTAPPGPAGDARIVPPPPTGGKDIELPPEAPAAPQRPAKGPKGGKPPKAAKVAPTAPVAPPAVSPQAAQTAKVTFSTPADAVPDAQLDSIIKQLRVYTQDHPDDFEVGARLAALETEQQMRLQRAVPQVAPTPTAEPLPGTPVNGMLAPEVPPTPQAAPVAQEATAPPTVEAPAGKGGKRVSKKLPKELAGAKPGYNIGATPYTPEFASDIDKAAYIIAQKKPSKQDAAYLKFVMEKTGLDEAGARAYGKEVRARLKEGAKTAKDGVIPLKKGQYGQASLPMVGAMAGGTAGALAPAGDEKNGINWKQRAVNMLLGAGAGLAVGHGTTHLPEAPGRPMWTGEEAGARRPFQNTLDQLNAPEPAAYGEQRRADMLASQGRDSEAAQAYQDLTNRLRTDPEFGAQMQRMGNTPQAEWTAQDHADFDQLYKEWLDRGGQIHDDIQGPDGLPSAQQRHDLMEQGRRDALSPEEIADQDRFMNGEDEEDGMLATPEPERPPRGQDGKPLGETYNGQMNEDEFNRAMNDDIIPESEQFTRKDWRAAGGPNHARKPWDDAYDRMTELEAQIKALWAKADPLRDQSWKLMGERHKLNWDDPQRDVIQAQEKALDDQAAQYHQKIQDLREQWQAAKDQYDLLNERTGRFDFVDYNKAMGEKTNIGDYDKMRSRKDEIDAAEKEGRFYKDTQDPSLSPEALINNPDRAASNPIVHAEGSGGYNWHVRGGKYYITHPDYGDNVIGPFASQDEAGDWVNNDMDRQQEYSGNEISKPWQAPDMANVPIAGKQGEPLPLGTEAQPQSPEREYLRNLLAEDSLPGMTARQVFADEGLTPDHLDLMDEEKLRFHQQQIQQQIDQFQPGGNPATDFLNNDEGSMGLRAATSLAGAAAGGLYGYNQSDDPELKWMGALGGAVAGGALGFGLGHSLARDGEMAREWEQKIAQLEADKSITPKQAARLREGRPLNLGEPRKAGALNLSNYDTDKGTKDFMQVAYKAAQQEIDTMRQLGVPMRVVEHQAQQLAQQAGMGSFGDITRLLRDKPQGVEDAIWLRAKVTLNLTAAEQTAREAANYIANPNDPQALANFYSSFMRYQDIQKPTQQAISQTARALRAMQNEAKAVKMDPAVLRLGDLLKKSGGDPGVAQAVAQKLAQLATKGATVSDINRFLRWTQGAKTMDQLHLLYTSMLVSRIPTQVANTLGNLMSLGSMGAEIPLAGIADKAISAVSNFKREGFHIKRQPPRFRTRYAGELPWAMRGLASGSIAAWDMAAQTMKTGVSAFEGNEISQNILQGIESPPPGTAMFYATSPLRFMQAADDFAKSLVQTINLHQLAYRKARAEGLSGLSADQRAMEIASNPEEVLQTLAKDEAHYRTYTKELGNWGENFGKLRNTASNVGGMLVKPLKWQVPFYRTDINILKQGLERSAIPQLLNMGGKALRGDYTLAPDLKVAAAHGQVPDFQTLNDSGKLADDSARVLMGAGLTAGAMWLVSLGAMTGAAPSDPAERALWRAKGIQPYSIKVGNQWVPFDRLGPAGLSLSMAADTAQIGKKYKTGGFAAAANQFKSAVTNQIVGRGLMMGLLSAANAVTEQSGAEAWAERVSSSFVPGLVSNINNVIDPVRRNPNSIMEAPQAHIPGMSQGVAPYRDLFGQVDQDQRTAAERLVSPINRSQEKQDPVLDWMLANGAGTTPGKGSLKDPNSLAEDPSIPMTIQERGVYEDAKGRAKYWAAQRLIQNPNFSTLPKSIQKKRVQAVMSQAAANVTRQVRAYKLNLHRPFTVENLTTEAIPPYMTQ